MTNARGGRIHALQLVFFISVRTSLPPIQNIRRITSGRAHTPRLSSGSPNHERSRHLRLNRLRALQGERSCSGKDASAAAKPRVDDTRLSSDREEEKMKPMARIFLPLVAPLTSRAGTSRLVQRAGYRSLA